MSGYDGRTRITGELQRAADDVAHQRWSDAYDRYRNADPTSFGGTDLEGYAEAAWWTTHELESIEIRQRAYAAYADEGEDLRAAWCAGLTCIQRFMRGEPAVAVGWLRRAQRHVNRVPVAPQHGFLAVVEGSVVLLRDGPDEAMPLIERAVGIGERFRDRNLLAMAIHLRGMALIASGRMSEGMADLDEAMTSVVAGELEPYFTGVIYCNVLEACLRVADLSRASEWSDAAVAWCESLPPGTPLPGVCRVNRAQVAGFRGRWADAEAEALRAAVELSWDPPAAALALYEAGEIQRRRGDLASAEESFTRARELGLEPQPGLGLLRIEQGKTEAGLASLRVAAGSVDPGLRGARLLAALVDAEIGGGDLEEARGARDRLAAIADAEPSPPVLAFLTSATAAVAVADPDGDTFAALAAARDAAVRWRELRMPYEAATARERCGVALRRVGDDDAAGSELRTALARFEELGAAADARRVAGLLAGDDARPANLTPRELEVLRLVAAGKTNREVAAALVLSEHTVARHLQNLFPKIGVTSRSGATAFAFAHGLA